MSWSLNDLWSMGLKGLNYYEVVGGGGMTDSILTIEFSSHLAMETLIGGPAEDVDLWNTFFDLPANGNRFVIAAIDGAPAVALEGGSNITLKTDLFKDYLDIISIGDVGTVPAVVSGGDQVFYGAHNLASIVLPGLNRIGVNFCRGNDLIAAANFEGALTVEAYAFAGLTTLTGIGLENVLTLKENVFDGCTLLNYVNLSNCTNLGGTVGNNNVFNATTEVIDVILATDTLMTCNAGSPDGDLQSLLNVNRLTVNGVVPGP